MHLPDPTLPPLLTGHPVSAPVRPFEAAVRGALSDRLSAGDLVWARDTGACSLAVVLEPDVGRARAMEMLPLAEVALADALGALLAPEIAVQFRWPDILLVNGAECGRFAVAMADGAAAPDAVPAWLVIGFEMRLAWAARRAEPGQTPDVTSLDQEGGGDIDRTRLIEAFSRHFTAWLNIWEDEGFAPVDRSWLGRAEGWRQDVAIRFDGEEHRGRFLGLDEHGNPLLECGGGVVALDASRLADATRRAMSA